jgi:hypothetical protein
MAPVGAEVIAARVAAFDEERFDALHTSILRAQAEAQGRERFIAFKVRDLNAAYCPEPPWTAEQVGMLWDEVMALPPSPEVWQPTDGDSSA